MSRIQRMQRITFIGSAIVLGCVTPSAKVLAQDPVAQYAVGQYADRGPRFFLASGKGHVALDVTRTPLLRRELTLNLEAVSIAEAIKVITRQAGFALIYRDGLIPAGARVSLRAEGIAVAAALTHVLLDAEVDIVFTGPRSAALVKRSATALPAAGSITGVVTDAKTKLPIRDAAVSVEGTNVRTTTSDSGRYRVAGVPAGALTISVRRIGYQKETRSVNVAADQVLEANFELQPSARVLDQVVVTGSLVETERKALPTPITVISAADIQAKRITRIDQLFHGEVPGMWARPEQIGDLLGGGNLYVRGSTDLNILAQGSSIKTYVDGIEMTDPRLFLLIDPSSIDRIEIIRGPQASTLYGVNALNGVMQIFTKKGQRGQRLSVEATIAGGTLEGAWTHALANPTSPRGTVPQMDNSLSVSGASSDLTYRVGAHHHYDGPYQNGAPSEALDGTAGLRLTQARLTLDVLMRAGRTTHQYPRLDYSAVQAVSGEYSFPAALNFLPNVRYTRPVQTIGGTLTVRATPAWQHVFIMGEDRNEFVAQYVRYSASNGGPGDSLYRLDGSKQSRNSVAYNTTFSHGIGKELAMSMTAGADHWDTASDLYIAFSNALIGTLNNPLLLQRITDHNSGYFTQVQLGFRDALFLTAGIRGEDNPNFGENHRIDYAPRVGLSYVRDFGMLTIKTRASYGRSIRPPAIGQKAGGMQGTGIYLSNPDLGPSSQLGGDAGMEVFYGSRFSFQVSYYDQTTRDLIAVVMLPIIPPYTFINQYQNVGKARNQGWELEGSAALSASLNIHGTYTIMNSHIITLGPRYVAAGAWPYNPGDQLRGVPDDVAAGTITYAHAGTTVDVSADHTGTSVIADRKKLFDGRFQRLNPPTPTTTAITTTPGFSQVHIRATHILTKSATIFAQVTNVANQFAPSFLIDYSNVGRSVLAGVRLAR